jgi:TPR repeat protein/uncharacterized caspase-like protein
MNRITSIALLAWIAMCIPAFAQSSGLMTFEEAKRRADNGDSFAQAVVALHYQLGWNTEKSAELASKYAIASANAGEPLGQFRLGALMREGTGVLKNEQQGLALQAASFSGLYNAQDPYSLTAAAIMIFQGKVVGQDIAQDERRRDAAALYKKAAEMGYAPAQFNYAMCADAGHGIPKSIGERDNYLQVAKYHGYPLAEEWLKQQGQWYKGAIGSAKALLRLERIDGEKVRGCYFTAHGGGKETTVFLTGTDSPTANMHLEAFHYGQILGVMDLSKSSSSNHGQLRGKFKRVNGQTEIVEFQSLSRSESAPSAPSTGEAEGTLSVSIEDSNSEEQFAARQSKILGDIHVVAQTFQPEYPTFAENDDLEIKTRVGGAFPSRTIYIVDKRTGLLLGACNTDTEGHSYIKDAFLARDSSFVAVSFWTSIGAGGGVKVYNLESGVPVLSAQHWSLGTVLGIDESRAALFIKEDGNCLKYSLFDDDKKPVVLNEEPHFTPFTSHQDEGNSSYSAGLPNGFWTEVDFVSECDSLRLTGRAETVLGASSKDKGKNHSCLVDLVTLETQVCEPSADAPTNVEPQKKYTSFYESIYPDRQMERGGSLSVTSRRLGARLLETVFHWWRLGECGEVDSGVWAAVEKVEGGAAGQEVLLFPMVHYFANSEADIYEANEHVARAREFLKFFKTERPPVALSGAVRTGLPVLRESKGQLLSKDEKSLVLFRDDLTVANVVPWEGSKMAIAVNEDTSLAAGIENASMEMNAVQIFDLRNQRLIGRLYAKPGSAVLICDDGVYMNRGDIDSLVGFREGKKTYPFEQFDLRLNRPDIILERLGAAADAVAIAKQMREKRLKRMGATEEMLKPDFHVPELEIVGEVPPTTDADEINVVIKASDSKYLLQRLKVHVNNVPVNGRDGELLREEAESDQGLLGRITGAFSAAPTGPQTLERTIPIKLAAGRNKIQISVLNNAGAESLYANAEVNCTVQRPKPTLYAVALGVSDYANPEWNLKYAAKDARDVLERLKTRSGGSYNDVKELLLTDKEVTKESLGQIRDFLKDATIDDTVLMFVAGHGLLDSKYDYYFGTTDIDFNNPAEKGIAFDEFDDLLAALPCLKKSLLIDTCHAGELDEEEKTLLASAGGTAAPLPTGNGIAMRSIGTRGMNVKAIEGARGASEWYDRLQGLFVDLRRGSGSTILSSSAGAEYALESSEQQNGLFTYAVLEALDGNRDADTNKDGSVQMSELGEYVKKRVAELTNNKQTPNTRRVNLEGDFTLARTM